MRYGFFNSDITGYDDQGNPIFDRAEDAEFFAKKFTQRINVSNMKEIYKPYPALINSTDEATELLEVENMYIKIIDTYDGYVVATCHNDKPAVDLNILLTVYKEQDNV